MPVTAKKSATRRKFPTRGRPACSPAKRSRLPGCRASAVFADENPSERLKQAEYVVRTMGGESICRARRRSWIRAGGSAD
jgi:hypothetical protein